MRDRNGFARFAAAACFSLLPLPGRADSGTVDLVLSGVSNTYTVQMGETTVTASGGNGTLTFTRSSGRPFVEGASAAVQYAGFSKKVPSGLDLEMDAVATFSPDDTLLLVFERRADDIGTADEGTLRLAGGSGRFAGVDGRCRYKMEDLPRDWNVTARCEWLYSFPYR